MHNRLKELRKALDLNQTDFASALGIGQSTLAMMEVGKRDISDRHVKAICAIYNVNEKWLRTGEGEMFIQVAKSILDDLKNKYKLDNLDMAIIESYLDLAENERTIFRNYITNVASRYSSANPPMDIGEQPSSVTRENIISEQIKDRDKMIALDAVMKNHKS